MRYIIDFVSDITKSQVDNYISQLDGSKIKEWDCFSTTVLVESASVPPKTDIVLSIINDEEETITPLEYPQTLSFNSKFNALDDEITADGETTFSTSDEKDWWKNYILATPDFDSDSVTIPRRGRHTSVYVMDSGITQDHPEFADVSIENIWSVTPGDFSDPHGHGTAIASVISGKTCGISNAKLKIVKIFRSDRGTFTSELLDALDSIFNSVEPNTVAVVNCSWSIPRNTFVEQRFQQLLDQGIMIIASAGNSGVAIEDVTPGAMHGVLTIGSYGPDLVPSNFSNYQGGTTISLTEDYTNSGKSNVWCPGEKIWAATKEGSYGYTAGTSMSAAIATMITAYKLSYYVDGSGYVLPEFAGQQFKLTWSKDPEDYKDITVIDPAPFVAIINYIKPDLLDLSDSRYSEANNWLISLPPKQLDMPKYNTYMRINEEATLLSRANTKTVHGILNKAAVLSEKIELLEPMPEFCSFTDYGDLIVNNASPGNYYLKFRITLDSIARPYTVELKILDEEISTDEINEIQLEALVCFRPVPPLEFCPATQFELQECIDDCPLNSTCCLDAPGFKGSLPLATDCRCAG